VDSDVRIHRLHRLAEVFECAEGCLATRCWRVWSIGATGAGLLDHQGIEVLEPRIRVPLVVPDLLLEVLELLENAL